MVNISMKSQKQATRKIKGKHLLVKLKKSITCFNEGMKHEARSKSCTPPRTASIFFLNFRSMTFTRMARLDLLRESLRGRPPESVEMILQGGLLSFPSPPERSTAIIRSGVYKLSESEQFNAGPNYVAKAA